MTWLPWALLAAVFAVTAEVLFRRGVDWHPWLFVPIALSVNYSIYRLVRAGPGLLVAVAAFSLMTLLARSLASQYLLDEPLTRGNLVAALGLGAAVVVGALWR